MRERPPTNTAVQFAQSPGANRGLIRRSCLLRSRFTSPLQAHRGFLAGLVPVELNASGQKAHVAATVPFTVDKLPPAEDVTFPVAVPLLYTWRETGPN